MPRETPADPDREYTFSELRMRDGWTKSNIQSLADPPDREKENRWNGTTKFYRCDRIHTIEDDPVAKEKLDQGRRRSRAGKSGANRRKTALIEEVRSCPILVTKLNLDDLQSKSIRHYNRRKTNRGDYDDLASNSSSPEHLARIAVNYIRHELTNYDKMIEANAGKPGKADAYEELVRRIFSKIASSYPEFADESARQRQQKLAEITRNESYAGAYQYR